MFLLPKLSKRVNDYLIHHDNITTRYGPRWQMVPVELNVLPLQTEGAKLNDGLVLVAGSEGRGQWKAATTP
jgi:hypothetical protein